MKRLDFLYDGLEVYSTVWGHGVVKGFNDNWVVFHKDAHNGSGFTDHYDEYGRFDDTGECLLWPSKDIRTWDGWGVNVGDICIGVPCDRPGEGVVLCCVIRVDKSEDGSVGIIAKNVFTDLEKWNVNNGCTSFTVKNFKKSGTMEEFLQKIKDDKGD